jgi:hypothetical protein
VHETRRCDREQNQSRRAREDDVADEVSSSDRRSLTRLFPVLRLMGTLRQAFDLRKLIIAALGLAILQPGFLLLDRLLPPVGAAAAGLSAGSPAATGFVDPRFVSAEIVSGLCTRLLEPYRLLATNLLVVIDPASGWGPMVHALLRVIWLIVVWAICGGAICRIAIVQVAAMRQLSIVDALRFAASRSRSLVAAPLCPLLGIGFCGAIAAAFGLVYRLPVVGPAIAGIGLVVPLTMGLVMTMLVAGLLGGWPLLQAAVAAGAEDALDALSRIFGYLNQRLGSYLFVVALTCIGGMLGLALVDLLTSSVIRLTQWSVGLTAPRALTDGLFRPTGDTTGGMAGATHAFWLGLVNLLAHAWVYSFYWTAAANLYLWLRHDTDGTPWTVSDPAVAVATDSGS